LKQELDDGMQAVINNIKIYFHDVKIYLLHDDTALKLSVDTIKLATLQNNEYEQDTLEKTLFFQGITLEIGQLPTPTSPVESITTWEPLLQHKVQEFNQIQVVIHRSSKNFNEKFQIKKIEVDVKLLGDSPLSIRLSPSKVHNLQQLLHAYSTPPNLSNAPLVPRRTTVKSDKNENHGFVFSLKTNVQQGRISVFVSDLQEPNPPCIHLDIWDLKFNYFKRGDSVSSTHNIDASLTDLKVSDHLSDQDGNHSFEKRNFAISFSLFYYLTTGYMH
jgi:hypothetical protein